MGTPHSSLSVRRTWLPPGYRAEYRLELEPNTLFLPVLADLILREILQPLVLSPQVLRNIKGRDQRNVLDQSVGAALLPQADEFFFVAGEILQSPKATGEGHEFSVAIESKYLPSGYEGMAHAAEVRRDQFPPDFDITRLGRYIPIHLKTLRMGFDLYQSRFISSMFGLVPTVTQTVLLEANEKRVLLAIDAESLKTRDQLPLEWDTLFARLNQVFKTALHFDVLEDYQAKLRIQ